MEQQILQGVERGDLILAVCRDQQALTLTGAERQDTHQTLGIRLTIAFLHPNGATERAGFVNEKSRRA